MLFFSLHWKCGRRRGEMGTFFFGKVFFIVEWLGKGLGGVFFLQIHYGGRGQLKVAIRHSWVFF
jgi:hypothetical protein